jgi:hypothetical protein
MWLLQQTNNPIRHHCRKDYIYSYAVNTFHIPSPSNPWGITVKLRVWRNISHLTVLFYAIKKLHGPSPQANYTDRATAACQQRNCQLLWIEGATCQRDESLRQYSRLSRQEPLLFYKVAPQLYSRGWVDLVSDPILFFLVVPGIEPGPPDL